MRLDFNKVVNRALRDHPELRSETVFIDAALDGFDAPEKKRKSWHGDLSVIERVKRNTKIVESLERTSNKARKGKTSFAQSYDDYGVKALTHYPWYRSHVFNPHCSMEEERATLNHELGHLVVEGAMDGTPYAENAADAYAIMRMIARGSEKSDPYYCGWFRAYQFLASGEGDYLTTFTVDHIAMNRANFVSLTPDQIAKVAHVWAKKFTPKDSEISKLREDFSKLKSYRWQSEPNNNRTGLLELALTTINAEVDSLKFYVGARVLAGILEPGGIKYGRIKIDLDQPKFNEIAIILCKKIDTLGPSHPLAMAAARLQPRLPR